jgi:hypothetical protein
MWDSTDLTYNLRGIDKECMQILGWEPEAHTPLIDLSVDKLY